MNEIYTVKRIDNSRLVRPRAAGTLKEWGRMLLFGSVLAAGGLLYAWQHFQCLQLKYQIEELKAERAQAAELKAQLRLEVAALKSPMRIDAIARKQLGLTAPLPGLVTPAAAPEGVLAQARRAGESATR